ncbi:S26 family signal peptidase [Actinomadura sp. HBU206391]|uniref:S26 family signal peptidase n=1 Tax=Actinomadura sp. HBU206391 TaxID=2731692 RepID=UPI00164EF75C|nr:S26 family signal peptidase [Actinomadura sp. HBU206391]MBC6459166.1 hypothetical protein [Actinomadura sp. HBU206391]
MGVIATVVVMVVAGLASVVGVERVMRFRRRWVVIRVRGESMYPTLLPGDEVLVRRCGAKDVSTGDIVVVESPSRDRRWAAPPARRWTSERRWLVKRVAALPGDRRPGAVAATVETREVVPPGTLIVLGDNAGFDSRAFGLLPSERLFGVVVRRMTR